MSVWVLSGSSVSAVDLGEARGVLRAGVERFGEACFVLANVGGVVRGFVVADVDSVLVEGLSRLVGAGVELWPGGLDLVRKSVGVLGHDFLQKSGGKLSLSGSDLSVLASSVGPLLGEGEWVGVGFRRAGKFEDLRFSSWVNERIGAGRVDAASNAGGVLACRVAAGSDGGWGRVCVLLEAFRVGLIEFSGTVRPVRVWGVPSLAWWLPLVFLPLVVACLWGLRVGLPVVGLPVGWVPGWAGLWGVLVAGLVGVLVLGLGWFLFGGRRRFFSGLSVGWVLPAGRVFLSLGWLRFRRFRLSRRGVDGGGVSRFVGDDSVSVPYPLPRDVLMLAPMQFVGLLVPQSVDGGGSGRVTGVRRPVFGLFDVAGPLAGFCGGRPVFLEGAQVGLGTAVLGDARSGKSEWLRNLFGWVLVSKSGADAVIDFEPKSDGAGLLVARGESLGVRVFRVDLLDAACRLRINFFDGVGGAESWGSDVVDALRYAFPEGAVGSRNPEILKMALILGRAVCGEDVVEVNRRVGGVGVLPVGESAVFYAGTVLGVEGPDFSVALFEVLRERLEREGEGAGEFLRVGVGLARREFVGVTDRQRAVSFESSWTKLKALRPVGHVFEPVSGGVSWRQIVFNGLPVVLCTQPPAGVVLDSSVENVAQSVALFSLFRFVQRELSGRGERGDGFVWLFADELSEIAGHNPEIIDWLKNKGGSFGLRVAFATQQAEQLDERVRTMFLGLPTLVAFTSTNPAVAATVASVMGSEVEPWGADDLRMMGRFKAAVRTRLGGVLQPAFTVDTRRFGYDVAGGVELAGLFGR